MMDGLDPAVGDFVAVWIGFVGFLEEGQRSAPILLSNELNGLLEEFVGIHLRIKARPALDRV